MYGNEIFLSSTTPTYAEASVLGYYGNTDHKNAWYASKPIYVIRITFTMYSDMFNTSAQNGGRYFLFYETDSIDFTAGATRTNGNATPVSFIMYEYQGQNYRVSAGAEWSNQYTQQYSGIYDDSFVYSSFADIVANEPIVPYNPHVLYPITYRLTNCSAPSAPTEAAVGDTVNVPLAFTPNYGVVNASNAYVTNNGVIIPSSYANGTLTFTMPDPS